MKTILTSFALFVVIALRVAAADTSTATRHPEERDGNAKIVHRADVVPDRSTNATARGGLWPLYSTPEARLNYFEVASRTSLHFHPDAEHRLYVLEGKVLVTCGTNTSTASWAISSSSRAACGIATTCRRRVIAP